MVFKNNIALGQDHSWLILIFRIAHAIYRIKKANKRFAVPFIYGTQHIHHQTYCVNSRIDSLLKFISLEIGTLYWGKSFFKIETWLYLTREYVLKYVRIVRILKNFFLLPLFASFRIFIKLDSECIHAVYELAIDNTQSS